MQLVSEGQKIIFQNVESFQILMMSLDEADIIYDFSETFTPHTPQIVG